jgi:pimeloyl-ACP methyl ester carboxylesterase
VSLVHRVLRKPFFGRFEVPWQFPRDASESRWERITFAGAKGARLSGLIGRADSPPIGSLVLAHPMGKAAKGFWLRHGHADLFRRAGFNVLFRAAVLEAAFPTLPDSWKHYAFAHAVLRVSQAVMPWFERSIRPEAAAARIVGNPDVLLIHGTKDRFTPVDHGERLLRAMQASARAELVILPGVDHTNAYRDAAGEYEARVIPFLQRAFS